MSRSQPKAALPVSAQLIVFDPNNDVQNVLTAARELQQIDNHSGFGCAYWTMSTFGRQLSFD
jgi:hypothetical protein